MTRTYIFRGVPVLIARTFNGHWDASTHFGTISRQSIQKLHSRARGGFDVATTRPKVSLKSSNSGTFIHADRLRLCCTLYPYLLC